MTATGARQGKGKPAMKITVKEISSLSQTCPKAHASQTAISALRGKKVGTRRQAKSWGKERRPRASEEERKKGLKEKGWVSRRGRGQTDR